MHGGEGASRGWFVCVVHAGEPDEREFHRVQSTVVRSAQGLLMPVHRYTICVYDEFLDVASADRHARNEAPQGISRGSLDKRRVLRVK